MSVMYGSFKASYTHSCDPIRTDWSLTGLGYDPQGRQLVLGSWWDAVQRKEPFEEKGEISDESL